MKRLRMALGACTALALMLTACGRVPVSSREAGTDAGGGGSGGQGSGGVVSIKVLGYTDPTMDALISAFYEKYPNYRVEKVPLQFGNNMNDSIKQHLSQGDVDVIQTYSTSSLVQDKLLAPLDSFVQKSKLDVKGYGPGFDNLKTDGKLYVLPYAIQPQVVVYNQDMFQAAGLQKPKEGWTWDEFRTTAAKLTKGDGDGKIYGFASDNPDSLIGMYVNQKSGQAKLVDDAADLREAFQLFTTMIFTDKSMPKAEKRDPNTPRTSYRPGDKFFQGKAAMAFVPLSFLRYGGAQVKFKWDIAALPVPANGKNAEQVYPQVLAMAANSKNQAAAWDFIRFVAGPEGAPVLARQGILPMYITPDVKAAWFEQQPAPSAGTEFLFNTTFTVTAPDPAAKPEKMSTDAVRQIFARISGDTNAALSGDKPWEEALNDYLKAQDELLKAME